MERLKTIAVRAPVKLIGFNFAGMFVWLSRGMEKIAQSRTDEQAPPAGPPCRRNNLAGGGCAPPPGPAP